VVDWGWEKNSDGGKVGDNDSAFYAVLSIHSDIALSNGVIYFSNILFHALFNILIKEFTCRTIILFETYLLIREY